MIPEAFTQVGVRLDLLVVGWIGLALLIVAAGLILLGAWDNPGTLLDSGFAFLGVLVGIAGALMGVIWLILLIPFDGTYHHLYRTTTVVQSVSNTFAEADGEITRTPVVELQGIDRPVVVDDPRIIRLEDHTVTFTCRIGWHYQAADTYSCEIYQIGATP